jgi:integrase
MRIRRRKNGYWYAIPENGPPISLRTKDREAALRAAADQERAPKGDTVADIMKAYLADKQDKPSYETGMLGAWKALQPHFGHLRPDQITRKVSKEYWVRRAGKSNGTIIKDLTVLRAALKWHDKNTPAVVVTPSSPPPRERFVTKAEYRKLFFNARTSHMKVFLALAWYTAARKEAILSLTWDRVNLETGRINFGPDVGKKGRAKALPINKALMRILRIHAHARASNWVLDRKGERIGNIKKGFAAAVERAGIEPATPHDMRRGAARHMIENGVPMEQVSKILGHTSVSVTAKVYAVFSPGYLKDAVSVL